jgi:hypothetical protein
LTLGEVKARELHQTLKTGRPAMAAGASDHVWAIEEIAVLIP